MGGRGERKKRKREREREREIEKRKKRTFGDQRKLPPLQVDSLMN
jgi:hypothetical protein